MTAPKPPLGWSRFAILMHALGALLIFALLGLGWAMVHAGFDMARTFDMFQLHKSLGFALLALTALRLAGRARQPAPGRLERYLKATGRRMNEASTANIAR